MHESMVIYTLCIKPLPMHFVYVIRLQCELGLVAVMQQDGAKIRHLSAICLPVCWDSLMHVQTVTTGLSSKGRGGVAWE